MDKLHRLHIELVLAVVSGVLGCLTVAAPQWLERVTGLEPDGGYSGFEWAVTAGLGAVAVAAALSARRRYQRLLAQRDAEGTQPPSSRG